MVQSTQRSQVNPVNVMATWADHNTDKRQQRIHKGEVTDSSEWNAAGAVALHHYLPNFFFKFNTEIGAVW